MNAGFPAHDPTQAPLAWSRQRWISVIVLLFVGQCATIYFLAQAPVAPELPPPHRTQTIFAAILGPGDGSLEAHPFHPAAIPKALNLQELRSRSGGSIPYPLDDAAPARQRLGVATKPELLGALLQEVRVVPVPKVEALPELPGSSPVRLRPYGTSARILGDLSSRRLVTEPPRLDWTSPQPLQPTIVQIKVNGLGAVLSGELMDSSGNKVADALALDVSRKLRFEAKPGMLPTVASYPTNLVWGRVVFQWGMPGTDEPSNR